MNPTADLTTLRSIITLVAAAVRPTGRETWRGDVRHR
jgi:hypothetical protein